VVVQSDAFNPVHESVTVCPFTSTLVDAPFLRLPVGPAKANDLKKRSQAMVNKVVTLLHERLRAVIGSLTEEQMRGVCAALVRRFDLPRRFSRYTVSCNVTSSAPMRR